MTRHRRAAVAVLATGLMAGAIAGTTAFATTPSPGVSHVHSPAGTVFFDNGSTPAVFPALYDLSSTAANGARSQSLLMTYSTGADVVGNPSGAAQRSTDGGATWQSFAVPDGRLTALNMVRLPDAGGTVMTVDFEPTAITAPPGARNTFHRRLISGTTITDGGSATVDFGEAITDSRFHRTGFLAGDGRTILATSYGSYADGDPFVVVIRSTDGGVTWTRSSTLYRGVSGDGTPFNETSIAPTSDGRLMAVLRRENGAGGIDLYKSFNADPLGGGTWSAPQIVSSDSGASPYVLPLANGTAVVSSGRFDDVVRYSLDGTGNTLSDKATLYTNYPTANRRNGTTGYQGMTAAGQNQMLVVGDNCRSECPASGTYVGPGKKNQLWKSVVEPDTAQWGVIDLQTAQQRGLVTFPGTTFSTYGSGRQSLGAYLFDGDVRADSSAVTANRTITVRLDRPYELTGIGAHAWLLGSSDLAISTSTNGTTWTTPARGTRQGIVRPFTAPVVAQYLRISDPNPGSSSTAGFLHELQVYTTTNGFEMDYPGQAPRGDGVTSAVQATVVDQRAVPAADRISSRFLRIKDTRSDQVASIQWRHPAASTATVSFRSRAYGTANNALLFTVLAPDSTSGANAPYHFMLTSTGRFHRYDPQTASWGSPLNATAVNANSWHDISVAATASTATLTVDGATVGTVPAAVSASSFDGTALGSAGTVPTGDDWLIDDLAFRTP